MNHFLKHTKTILFLLIPFLSMAQSSKIAGTIIDQQTQEPLIGVNVSVDSSILGAITDFDGKYEINELSAGTYRLVISYIGYNTKTIEQVVVKEQETTTLNIVLELASNELAEVQIVGFKKVMPRI